MSVTPSQYSCTAIDYLTVAMGTPQGKGTALQEFVKFPKLRKLILDGNLVEPAYIKQIRSTLSGIEVVKNDVVKP